MSSEKLFLYSFEVVGMDSNVKSIQSTGQLKADSWTKGLGPLFVVEEKEWVSL